LTPVPAQLDRVVETGGGGGSLCMPGPCPEVGSLRIDAGDADLVGNTTISQSATDPLSFTARTNFLLNLAGHVAGGITRLDVANRTMSVSLSLVGPTGDTLEITGEAEAVQTESVNLICLSDRELRTRSTFVLRYLGRTEISEVHCIAP
jgi:hypothetical protein